MGRPTLFETGPLSNTERKRRWRARKRMQEALRDEPPIVLPDQLQNLRGGKRRQQLRFQRMAGTGAPMLIVTNVLLVADGAVIALLDIVEPAGRWRHVFRQCRWVRDRDGERIEPADGVPFEFFDPTEAAQFQRLALRAAREEATPSPFRPRRPSMSVPPEAAHGKC